METDDYSGNTCVRLCKPLSRYILAYDFAGSGSNRFAAAQASQVCHNDAPPGVFDSFCVAQVCACFQPDQFMISYMVSASSFLHVSDNFNTRADTEAFPN